MIQSSSSSSVLVEPVIRVLAWSGEEGLHGSCSLLSELSTLGSILPCLRVKLTELHAHKGAEADPQKVSMPQYLSEALGELTPVPLLILRCL